MENGRPVGTKASDRLVKLKKCGQCDRDIPRKVPNGSITIVFEIVSTETIAVRDIVTM